MTYETPWGPSGRVVFDRTYSRPKSDGTKETWPETVSRVVRGNLALVHGDEWTAEAIEEGIRLEAYMNDFAILPAGRHLWATGVEGRQYLFNCHVAGWGSRVTEHFEFTALRLFEGGGVGTNYSARHLEKYGQPKRKLNVQVICKPGHQDEAELTPFLTESPEHGLLHMVGDSREGWADAISLLLNSAFKERSPDTLVFDVSAVRPSGSPLVSSGGTASGPAPFAKMILDIADILNRDKFNGLSAMEIDHAIAECVVAGGNRRSARMSIMRWDDPSIFDFINCKADSGKHWTTNISVEIDNDFLACLSDPHSGASQVHAAVCGAMLENGEPGYWNSSLSQMGEHGDIIATNPCGEIALEAWENCNLGHVNLDYFFGRTSEELADAHRLMTRFLVRATYGDVNDSKQAEKLALNRRIGVGHLGVQSYWAKRGIRYSDIPDAAGPQLRLMYSVVRQEARAYSAELGIPEPVKVTTVAPTGSVAKLPGVTEGIHPLYAKWFEQRIRFSMRDAAQANTVLEAMEQGFRVEDDVYDSSGMTKVVVYPTENILMGQVRAIGGDDSVVQSADELSVSDMLEVQKVYQTFWADNAVSYTVNIEPGYMTADRLGSLLAKYLPYLKGTTIMVDASRPQSPYTRITQDEYKSAVATRVEDSTDLECSSGACPVR